MSVDPNEHIKRERHMSLVSNVISNALARFQPTNEKDRKAPSGTIKLTGWTRGALEFLSSKYQVGDEARTLEWALRQVVRSAVKEECEALRDRVLKDMGVKLTSDEESATLNGILIQRIDRITPSIKKSNKGGGQSKEDRERNFSDYL